MGEGYDGKIPELMTMYTTSSGDVGYRYTPKPTCILYKDVCPAWLHARLALRAEAWHAQRYTQLRSIISSRRFDTGASCFAPSLALCMLSTAGRRLPTRPAVPCGG